MKKKILLASAMLFFSILPLALFTSCDKDTNCYLKVFVIDDDTKMPISGAIVNISQTNGGTVRDEGITGTDGTYTAKFSAPAIVKVNAALHVTGGERRGETQVRLLEGETLTAKINLTSQIYY